MNDHAVPPEHVSICKGLTAFIASKGLQAQVHDAFMLIQVGCTCKGLSAAISWAQNMRFCMHTKLVITQSSKACIGLSTIWTQVALRMLRAPVFNKILEVEECLLALAARMLLSPLRVPPLHVPLQLRFLNFLITFWTPESGGRIRSLVCSLMLLELRYLPKSCTAERTPKLLVANQVFR